MSETEALRPTGTVDEQFLQQVDASLSEIVGRVEAQEQELGALAETPREPQPGGWHEIMNRINTRLDDWQAKLTAVAGHVREVEAELQSQQDALRGWTAALEAARRLPAVPPTATVDAPADVAGHRAA